MPAGPGRAAAALTRNGSVSASSGTTSSQRGRLRSAGASPASAPAADGSFSARPGSCGFVACGRHCSGRSSRTASARTSGSGGVAGAVDRPAASLPSRAAAHSACSFAAGLALALQDAGQDLLARCALLSPGLRRRRVRISRRGSASSDSELCRSRAATLLGRRPSSFGGSFMRRRQMRPLPWTGYDLSTQSLR